MILLRVTDIIFDCTKISKTRHERLTTVRSESHSALRLRYVDLAVGIEVAVEVCCSCVTFLSVQLLNSGWSAIPVQCLIA